MSSSSFGWAAASALVTAALVGGALYLTQPQMLPGGHPTLGQSSQAGPADEVIRSYLLKNPEVLIEAMQVLEARQNQVKEDLQKVALGQSHEALYGDASDPIIGSADGDIVVVEFFDYQCGYCKRVAPGLQQTIAQDGNIKVVMKEFPILGEASVIAARAALAAQKQDKYEEMHWALMNYRGRLNETVILALANDLALDVEKLKQDMIDPEVTAHLERVRQVAQKLQINGTPAFIIGEELVPGALSMESFRAKVDEARASQG
ncbi:DsbA family protein [Rhodovibrionaceae bacterium A322]